MPDAHPPTAPQTLKLELVRSPIGGTQRQRATVIALGLRKLHQVVEHAMKVREERPWRLAPGE